MTTLPRARAAWGAAAATIVGATAVALATPGASPVAAVAAPGQPVENDYGQSAVEVAGEINPVVAADPAVVRTVAAQARAHSVLVARIAAQARAKAVYVSASRNGSRARIQRAYTAYVAAITATAKAKTAYSTAIRTAKATRATVTSRVRATHYQPKDGVFTGVLKSYLVPTVPFSFEPMQVQITVYGGHVSDVVVTAQAEPTTDSASYNDKSLSTLALEAMAADGTSEIAAVSGASLTSRAFADSLHSALVNAGFKG